MSTPSWPPPGDVGEILIDTDTLGARVKELGNEIAADYAGRSPVLVSVLKGAICFVADLAREIPLPVELEFMAVSSYGGTRSTGAVKILKDLDVDVAGRDILIVEDIVDTGLTLDYLLRILGERRPASIEVCSLLVREVEGKPAPELRYVGFRLPPVFVIGYGLDVDGRYRNLPYVASYTGEA
ncbi:MAG: hypoxanthine phosphoribosyltransferase [Actinomycetota bacterium]|nr:hypoxanthine phosphoribosyltransferase [Actinomycetota bacterium]